MERERALVIRSWRVELECTWRKVAELAAKVWPNEFTWPDQITGRSLCIEAAETLGEDTSVEPWN